MAQWMLSTASELVVIGTKLRSDDLKLCEIIQRSVRPDTKIVAVGVDELIKRLGALLKRDTSVFERYKKFTDYTAIL
jgi:hypothetical protein